MTINWGILGAGKFALTHMGPAIHLAKGARLAALASGSSNRVSAFQSLAPDIRVFDDYDALLDDPSVDAVYIPLPNHLHVEWTLKALSAGKSVLCEKPLGLTVADYDRVIAARNQTGILAAEAFMITHHPQWQLARDLVQGGDIGTLLQVDAAFSYNNVDPDNIRNRPETGGGSLPDIGVYTLGGTRFVTGQDHVEITHADLTFENGIDTTARVSARFPEFIMNSMTSMRMAPRQEIVFQGSTGVLRLPAPFNPGVFGEARVLLDCGNQTREWRFTADNHYVHQVEAFGRAISDGDYECPLEFSRGTQKMIDEVFSKSSS